LTPEGTFVRFSPEVCCGDCFAVVTVVSEVDNPLPEVFTFGGGGGVVTCVLGVVSTFVGMGGSGLPE
jgi:hypothetical protein